MQVPDNMRAVVRVEEHAVPVPKVMCPKGMRAVSRVEEWVAAKMQVPKDRFLADRVTEHWYLPSHRRTTHKN